MADAPRPRRPFAVTALALAVFLLSAANVFSALVWLARRDLPGYDSALTLWRVGLAVIWAIVWVGLAVGLWRTLRPARTATIAAVALYMSIQVVLRAASAVSLYEQGRWPFLLGVGLLATGLVSFILTRPRVVATFETTPTKEQP